MINDHFSHLLKKFKLFHTLSDEALLVILNKLEVEEFPANVNIVTQGNYGDKIYFLIDGTVQAYVIDKHGEEITVAVLKQGDFFGELAVLTNGFRCETGIVY